MTLIVFGMPTSCIPMSTFQKPKSCAAPCCPMMTDPWQAFCMLDVVPPFIHDLNALSARQRHSNQMQGVNDRSEGSKLQESWERTQQVWNEEFGGKVATAGGMFRGNVTLEERSCQAKQWELLTQGSNGTQRFWIALRAEYCNSDA